MATQSVGIREFRDKLATYLLGAEGPVTITRHGDTVGYFIPARGKRTEEERAVLRETMAKWHETLALAGIDEDEVVEDFKRWRQKPEEHVR